VSERRFLLILPIPSPVVSSKKFLRVCQSNSELFPELAPFVFLLQFELVFTGMTSPSHRRVKASRIILKVSETSKCY